MLPKSVSMLGGVGATLPRKERQEKDKKFQLLMTSIAQTQNKAIQDAEEGRRRLERVDQVRAEQEEQRAEEMRKQHELQAQYMETEMKQREAEQKFREAEAKSRKEQHKKELAEKERQQRIRLLPAPQPMTSKEDVADYLEMFTANMTDREIPKVYWAHHLLPSSTLTARQLFLPCLLTTSFAMQVWRWYF